MKAGDYKEKGWDDDASYGISKLGCTLLARAYQQHFTDTAPEGDIVVKAVCSIIYRNMFQILYCIVLSYTVLKCSCVVKIFTIIPVLQSSYLFSFLIIWL